MLLGFQVQLNDETPIPAGDDAISGRGSRRSAHYLRLMFAVDDLDDTLAPPHGHGIGAFALPSVSLFQ